MTLTRNSKLLSKANEDNYYVMIYHNTPVLYWDKVADNVTLKHNGYHTRATAAAMNYALEDIGLECRVALRNGELQIMYANESFEQEAVSNGYDFNYQNVKVA